MSDLSFPPAIVRVLGALSLALALGSCLDSPAGGEGIHAVPRHLADDDPHRERIDGVRVLGILQLTAGHRRFGGLSGLAVDGDRFTAISDAGHWFGFTVDSDAEGRPQSARDLDNAPLGGLDGSQDDSDAEEIVAMPDGWVVSFERRHRLLLYRNGLGGQPERIALPPGFDRMPKNGGAEAVTQLADGRLLVIGEEGDRHTSPAWVGGPAGWQTLTYRRHDGFHPTSLARLPDGSVMLLERRFSVLSGVAIRLVHLDTVPPENGDQLTGREIMRLTPPLLVDNFEGLAARRRADGNTILYLISDDNFSRLQVTLLMAVLLENP
ncbi:MAG: esterase-like activity of phytase family protein [Magnetospirillum sp.]|nr:esterase-like activity of phytase family protein [Magnetospirillum sp.]